MQLTSISLGDPGKCQRISISGTSAQSAAIPSDNVLVYATTDCFVRQGSNPTALSDGTDQFVPAFSLFRLSIRRGSHLAFISTGGTGLVYLTPGG